MNGLKEFFASREWEWIKKHLTERKNQFEADILSRDPSKYPFDIRCCQGKREEDIYVLEEMPQILLDEQLGSQ